jgi:acetaldehyde dehydrogenase/alcohol dehydrogenase
MPPIAGMAFANAFLAYPQHGSQAGRVPPLPHGIANALLIDLVLRYNAAEVPAKMGTFPQYDHPHTPPATPW